MVGVEVGTMNRSRWCGVGVVALLLLAGLGALAEPCTITVQPGESIQEAIDAASPGDVICLAEGEWEENLVIEESLTLRAAEIKPETQAVIRSARSGWPVIWIESEEPIDVTVQGLMITGAFGRCYQTEPERICAHGISVHGKATAVIENNTISGNWDGIGLIDSSQATIDNNTISDNRLVGIGMRGSSQVTITNNTISDNLYGIGMWDSAQATIEGNTVSGSGWNGIVMLDSSQATIDNNTISDHELVGIGVFGLSQATIKGNTISDNGSGIVMYDSSQATIDNNTISDNRFDGIAMHGSSQATIENNTLSANRGGIWMWGSSQATIDNNTISDNRLNGIVMEDSSQATIQNNTISDNGREGIRSASTELVQGSGNRMSGNHPDLSGNVSARLRVPLVPETQETDLTFPGPYRTLQETIDAVAPGGTITVAPGTHQGGLTIWKPLILKGAERDEVVIEGAVSLIDEAQAVEIVGLTIASSPNYGLTLGARAKATITGSTISDNRYGIWMEGSAQATITGSTITDNRYGIRMRDSSQATIDNNTISDNGFGIKMEDSSVATIENNTISDNFCGILMWDSSQATIEDNTISGNRSGIEMVGSSQATIEGNTITDNRDDGIRMRGSSQATIAGNNIQDNERYGVALLEQPCAITDSVFTGYVTGRGNTGAGNVRGDTCPDVLTFLFTEEGGELDRRE